VVLDTGKEVMKLSYRHASSCANLFFDFLKKVVRDQRLLTASLFVLNISPSFVIVVLRLEHCMNLNLNVIQINLN